MHVYMGSLLKGESNDGHGRNHEQAKYCKSAFHLCHLHSIELQMQTEIPRGLSGFHLTSIPTCDYSTLHLTPTCRKGTHFPRGPLRSMTCTVGASPHVLTHAIENLQALKKKNPSLNQTFFNESRQNTFMSSYVDFSFILW